MRASRRQFLAAPLLGLATEWVWPNASLAADPDLMRWTTTISCAQCQFDEGWNPQVLDWEKAAGIQLTDVRFNFLQTKTANGDFSVYVSALNKMKALGLKHYLSLFGAPYVGDADVYAAWALKAMLWHVQHDPGQLRAVEIWNEPNGTHWPMAAADYLSLVAKIHALKAEEPSLAGIPLCGPVTTGASPRYMQTVIDGGLLNYVDVVSYHQYVQPEEILPGVALVKGMIKKAGRSTPIFISEFGGWGDRSTAKMERALTLLRATHSGASYFALRDYPTFPYVGLLTDKGALKAEGAAWIRWHSKIGDDATLVRDRLNDTTYSYARKKGSSNTRVMWAIPNQAVLIDGQRVVLTDTPIYIDGASKVLLAS